MRFIDLPYLFHKRSLLIFAYLFIHVCSFGQREDSLTVVSWNVFMRPSILADGQMNRIDSVGNYLLKLDADVVVLQELFHKRARRRLLKQIKPNYPYYTKRGRRTFFGVSSGICILTKDSIFFEDEISYKKATGFDRLAKKGASMIHFHHKGRSFNLFGTHLQAGGGEEGAHIRESQLVQLASFSSTASDTISTICAGDFNIRETSKLYDQLLRYLNTVNYEPTGMLKSTANFTDHRLTNCTGESSWIDYILLRKEDKVHVRSSRIEEPRCFIKQANERISDHNPIITVFEW